MEEGARERKTGTETEGEDRERRREREKGGEKERGKRETAAAQLCGVPRVEGGVKSIKSAHEGLS